MGVPSPSPMMRTKKTKAIGIPTIDLSASDRPMLSETIVRACEEYGIFKVVNHAVSRLTIASIDQHGTDFFAKSQEAKRRAGPAAPFGYGCKNIGPNGDMGELEYLLLQANPSSVSEISGVLSDEPTKFSGTVNDYTKGVGELACEILDLVGEGLGLSDKTHFSSMIRDVQSDSLLRLNHYPRLNGWDPLHDTPIGFGEHSDPQILTLLRSNDVPGLQISLHHQALWLPVPPDPHHFYVFVGDALQALTNGRLKSVRHRAMTNTSRARMSTVFFGAPSLNTWICPLPELVSPQNPTLYRPFTWAQYKKAAYSLRLGDSRIDLFKINHNHHHNNEFITIPHNLIS